jgi:hypothetical protein
MLVLLMGRIYDVCRSDDLRWQDIDIKCHDDQFRNSSDFKGIPQQFEKL